MANSSSVSFKSGALVLGIIGAAVGLNLTIMGIGAAELPDEAAVASTSIAGSEVRQVVVDVPVPINTQQTAADSASATLAPPATAAQAPPATAVPTSVSPATVSPTTAPGAAPEPSTTERTTQPTPVPPSTEYLSFDFEGVATIVVAYHNAATLEFWSATTADGWAFMVEEDESDEIELKFRRVAGAEGEAKFALSVENGELEVKKER